MSNFFELIVNFFASLFGGNKQTTTTKDATKNADVSATNTVKDASKCINSNTLDFILSECDPSEIDTIKQTISDAEDAGIYSYKLNTKNWIFEIEDGNIAHCLTVGEKDDTQTSAYGSNPEKCMKQGTINLIVAGLPDSERESVIAEIHEHEKNSVYEYDLSTSKWTFHIVNGQIAHCDAKRK